MMRFPSTTKVNNPSEIPPEDLEQLDGEAMNAEVDKLSKLGVVKVLSMYMLTMS